MSTTNLDPFRTGTGRWLDAQRQHPGQERRARALFGLQGRPALVQISHSRQDDANDHGMLDVFNVFDPRELRLYLLRHDVQHGAVLAAWRSARRYWFYQPRMVQVGFRITY